MDMLVEELLLSRRGHSKASMQAPGVLEVCALESSCQPEI